MTPELLLTAEPTALLSPGSPRILCTHATKDGAVPYACTRDFVEACHAKGVECGFYSYAPRSMYRRAAASAIRNMAGDQGNGALGDRALP